MSRNPKTYSYDDLEWHAAEKALEGARERGYGGELEEDDVRDIIEFTLKSYGFRVEDPERGMQWEIDFMRPGDSHVKFSALVADIPKFFAAHKGLAVEPESLFEEFLDEDAISFVRVNMDGSVDISLKDDDLTDDELEDLSAIEEEVEKIADDAGNKALWAVVKEYEARNSDKAVEERLRKEKTRFTEEGRFA